MELQINASEFRAHVEELDQEMILNFLVWLKEDKHIELMVDRTTQKDWNS